MRTLATALLMLSVLSGCASLPTDTAVDRLKPLAASHARALAGDDMPAARETGLALLAGLEALAGW
jgi:uncharacterized protein YceK